MDCHGNSDHLAVYKAVDPQWASYPQRDDQSLISPMPKVYGTWKFDENPCTTFDSQMDRWMD